MAKRKEATQQALYRKYRPQAFKDVLGQEQVVNVLEGALSQKHVAHAYLFHGPRGTGKTSVARIVAQELGTTEKDLYEIDGASYRGIDAIRELQESVRTLPFESDYKIYIVDEVHMLTKEAFNAFLKTLEEPPSHAVFILATTELHKVPDTIISRCEIHHFKKPSRILLKDHVKAIAKKEGFTLEASAADLIGLLAEGSFRDAQGILQKIIRSSKDKKIRVADIETVTGAPKGEVVNTIITALDTGDAEKTLDAISRARDANVDMQTLATLLLEKLRAVLLLRFAPTMKGELAGEFGDDDMEILTVVAKNKDTKITSEALKTFIDAYTQIGRASLPELPLELAVIGLVEKEKEV